MLVTEYLDPDGHIRKLFIELSPKQAERLANFLLDQKNSKLIERCVIRKINSPTNIEESKGESSFVII